MTLPAAESITLDERDLSALVASLSLEQKVRLLTGADFWSLHAEPAAGLRRMVVSDGPAGVRGERWDERDPSANVPSATGLAATWNEDLVRELGGLLAFEARRMGVDVVLAPTVNLHRTPYGGRHFECFSEDPLLTARIGTAYLRGLQEAGVAATVKHFIANDSETERMNVDVRLDERTLRELYLAPFEAIVREAGAWALMASYNSVNSERMTESSLLQDVLLRELGFDGLVMSDWFATRSTEASARAGLDLVMPGPDGPWGAALLRAVREGAVDRSMIDEKVLRVLRLATRVGALDAHPAVTPPHYDDAKIAATLRRAAAAGFVLASNHDRLLPLTHTVAVSGVGRYRLSVGGTTAFDGCLKLAPGADVIEGLMLPPQAPHRMSLDRGQEVDVVLAHEFGDAGDAIGVSFQLGLQPPHGTDDEEIERAASLASEADAVVLVVGTTEEIESEGFDRLSLSLPGRQDDLVRRVTAANPNTVAVVNAGAPVLLPWADDVGAVLLAWLPGQEFGNALADVLLGLAEPGGRLPTTWPSDERDLPTSSPVDGVLRYDEGLSIGYRRSGAAPLYPFGHGLGWATGTYFSIDARKEVSAGIDVQVKVHLLNTGPRRSREVVQLYASRPHSSIERPVRWLAGFAAVDADPGEQVTATVTVNPRAFEHWDVDTRRWAMEPGAFRLSAGRSSALLPLSTEIMISGPVR